MWDRRQDSIVRSLSQFLGWSGDVVLASRASLGLESTLRTWRLLHDAQLVALAPIVCQDVVAAIESAGCRPYFVDVDGTSAEVSDTAWAAARRAGCTVAVVVHLYGRMSDTTSVASQFDGSECLVIDDAAQALGSRDTYGSAGAMGDVGLVSFGASKHISTGGAALMIRDSSFAELIAADLDSVELVDPAHALAVEREFRIRFDIARDALLAGDGPGGNFVSLLNGYETVLRSDVDPSVMIAIPAQLDTYASRSHERLEKAHAWRAGLTGSRLVPVEFGAGDIPWRFACRMPEASWAEQRRVADAIRRRGIFTSNWYLPANWYIPSSADAMVGAESFAREAFQFWIDETITLDEVHRSASIVRGIVGP